jgi:hypothetical protein
VNMPVRILPTQAQALRKTTSTLGALTLFCRHERQAKERSRQGLVEALYPHPPIGDDPVSSKPLFAADGRNRVGVKPLPGLVVFDKGLFRFGSVHGFKARTSHCQRPLGIPHWRPLEFPRDGHENSPRTATELPGVFS